MRAAISFSILLGLVWNTIVAFGKFTGSSRLRSDDGIELKIGTWNLTKVRDPLMNANPHGAEESREVELIVRISSEFASIRVY